MRRVLAVVAASTVVCAAGCGGSQPASPATTTVARVVDGQCDAFALRYQPKPVQQCTFVLSDGERFGCAKPFTGETPTAAQLIRSGCRRLASLRFSAAERALVARIDAVRTCLTARRLRAVGGPVLPTYPPGGPVVPSPPSSSQPRGELVITSSHPTFIAFYANAAQAARVEPALVRMDAGSHVEVERRGAATVIWSSVPTSKLRSSVWGCLPQ